MVRQVGLLEPVGGIEWLRYHAGAQGAVVPPHGLMVPDSEGTAPPCLVVATDRPAGLTLEKRCQTLGATAMALTASL